MYVAFLPDPYKNSMPITKSLELKNELGSEILCNQKSFC